MIPNSPKNRRHIHHKLLTIAATAALFFITASISTAQSGQNDGDGDGIPNASDNCPTVPNPLQENTDITAAPPVSWDFIVNGNTDTIEPDVSIFRNEPSTPGPFHGRNIVFDTADADSTLNNPTGCTVPCSLATFTNTTNEIGQKPMCGYTFRVDQQTFDITRQITAYDQTVCALANGRLYEFDFKRFRDPKSNQCILEGSGDPGALVDCEEGGSRYVRNSYNIDNAGDACDCESDGFCTAESYCAQKGTPDPDCGTISDVPDPVTDLTATAGNTVVHLTWTAPDNNGSNITDYIIQYFDGTWHTFNDGTSANTNTTVTGLTNFTTYTFRVFAVNGNGQGPESNHVEATPVPCPGPLRNNDELSDNPLTIASEACIGASIDPGEIFIPYVPDSFFFPHKPVSSDQQNSFSNDNPATPSVVDVTTGPEDILTVADLRGTDNFTVNITATSFTSIIGDELPLGNLYVVTSTPSPASLIALDPGLNGTADNTNGLVYATGSTGQNITSNTATTGNLNLPAIYTTDGRSFDANNDNIPDIIELMSAQTAEHFLQASQALSFYLNIPANQPQGSYAVKFTITVM